MRIFLFMTRIYIGIMVHVQYWLVHKNSYTHSTQKCLYSLLWVTSGFIFFNFHLWTQLFFNLDASLLMLPCPFRAWILCTFVYNWLWAFECPFFGLLDVCSQITSESFHRCSLSSSKPLLYIRKMTRFNFYDRFSRSDNWAILAMDALLNEKNKTQSASLTLTHVELTVPFMKLALLLNIEFILTTLNNQIKNLDSLLMNKLYDVLQCQFMHLLNKKQKDLLISLFCAKSYQLSCIWLVGPRHTLLPTATLFESKFYALSSFYHHIHLLNLRLAAGELCPNFSLPRHSRFQSVVALSWCLNRRS